MTGLVKVERNDFALVAETLARNAAVVVQETAEDIAEMARRQAPKQTGDLAGSISVAARSAPGVYRRVVDVDMFYGLFQEMGTVKMSARPFLIPAVEVARYPFESAVLRLLG